jgi:hypothetical protein
MMKELGVEPSSGDWMGYYDEIVENYFTKLHHESSSAD